MVLVGQDRPAVSSQKPGGNTAWNRGCGRIWPVTLPSGYNRALRKTTTARPLPTNSGSDYHSAQYVPTAGTRNSLAPVKRFHQPLKTAKLSRQSFEFVHKLVGEHV